MAYDLTPGVPCLLPEGTRVVGRDAYAGKTGVIAGHWPSGHVRFPYLVRFDDGEPRWLDAEATQIKEQLTVHPEVQPQES